MRGGVLCGEGDLLGDFVGGLSKSCCSGDGCLGFFLGFLSFLGSSSSRPLFLGGVFTLFVYLRCFFSTFVSLKK